MADLGAPRNHSKDYSGGQRPTYVRWLILGLLMSYAGMVHFNRISISIAGTEHIIPDYKISPTEMGAVYTTYLVVYTLFMMPGGWFIDRFGPKKALLLLGFGSAIFVPATALAGYVGVAWMLGLLFVVRGALGLVSAPIHPAAARAASFWLPYSGRGKANGLITGAALLGIAATPYGFGLLSDRITWPVAFLVAGVLTLLLTIVWAYLATDHPGQHRWANAAEAALITAEDPVPQTEQPVANDAQEGTSPNSPVGPFTWVQRNLSMLTLTLSYACYSYFQYLFFYWMGYYFDTELKLGTSTGRAYTTITLLAMAGGMFTGGVLLDSLQSWKRCWFSRAITPMFGMVASGFFVLLGTSTSNPVAVVTWFALSMGALGMCEAPFWVTAVELGRKKGGASGAFLNTIGNLGGILAPLVTPLFSSYFGWKAGLLLAAGIVAVGAVFWVWVNPPVESSA